jgi:hypothetical protein
VFSSLTTTMPWDCTGYPSDLDGLTPRKLLIPFRSAPARSKILF